ncbi:piRNA biogenesis protein EXD1-like [Clytia hemisphaerica]|uniref:3'-5' exonuclease domain-containing protein n=1 Tax=Clytia hemisphaerica TaxID=252671 RepID=A0A7M5X001_9CNID
MSRFEKQNTSSLKVKYSFQLRELDKACQGFKPTVRVIDEISGLREVCDRLKGSKEIAVDCEGVDLGRDGKLTLIQLMAGEDTVILIDVLVLGESAFKYGLKEILESKEIVKLMFDCRNDSVSLWYEYGVKVTNVLDMQLLEYMVRAQAGHQFPSARRSTHWHKPRVRGLDATTDKYVRFDDKLSIGISDVRRVKERATVLMRAEKTVWRYRPLTEGFVRYAALDVVMINVVKKALARYKSLEGNTLKKLEIASERYVSARRDCERIDDFYVSHPILICYIIPEEIGGIIQPFPYEGSKCSGCKRMLTSSCMRNGKCGDCREVERRNGPNRR